MHFLTGVTGGFIVLCFFVFVVFWIVTAFSTKRTVQRSGWWRPLSVAVVVVVLLARLAARDTPWVTGVLWRHTLWSGLTGDLLALAGLVVMLWARTTLGRNWSAGVVLKEDQELVTRGPYRFVRHPIYSGLLLMFLGWAVWRGRYSGFWGWGIALLLFWIKAIAEERLMTQHFGDAYRHYKARVKALVPYVL
jgi:protein-S-isoprenylcysteine O-methyltransferase Ste14